MKTLSAVLSLLLVFSLLPTTTHAFWERHDVDNPHGGGYDIELADLDGDGDLDVVGHDFWWQNDGAGNFPQAFEWFELVRFKCADLDGDGDIDVAGLEGYSSNPYNLWIRENLGDGTFQYVQIGDGSYQYLTFGDLDSDGDIDIAAGRTELYWYENLGSLEFQEHEIYPTSRVGPLHIVDLDEDGDMDILQPTGPGQTGMTRWHENDGNQNFEWHYLGLKPTEWGFTIPADTDGDGDLDIVAGGDLDNHRQLAVFENLGAMTYAVPNVIDSRTWIADMTVSDMDGDGDVDVCGETYRPGQITLFRNGGDASFTQFPVRVFTSANPLAMAVGDIDGDGLKDVVAVSDDWVSWFEQPNVSAVTADLSNDGQVTLTWMGGGENLIEFRVYRDRTLLGTTTDRQFVDQLPAMDKYTYHVVALATDEYRTIADPVVVAWPAPSELTIDHDGNGNVTVSWEAGNTSFGGELDEFTEYRVFRNNQFLTATNSTSIADQLPEMGYYDYRVIAFFGENGINFSEPAGLLWTDTDDRFFDDFNDTFHRTWTVSSTAASNTWNWVDDDPQAPSPYVCETGPPGCYLVSPPIDISGLTTVWFEYDFMFFEDRAWNNGRGEVYYGFTPNGPWYEEVIYRETMGPVHESRLLLPLQIYGDTLYLSFRARQGLDDAGWCWFAIDNVRVRPDNEALNSAVSDPLADTDAENLPNEFGIQTVYPNPFNAATTITVNLPEASELSVTVYNIAGQQVAELANGQVSAGTHDFTFDASHLASGLYFVRASVPGQMDTMRKLMLVR